MFISIVSISCFVLMHSHATKSHQDLLQGDGLTVNPGAVKVNFYHYHYHYHCHHHYHHYRYQTTLIRWLHKRIAYYLSLKMFESSELVLWTMRQTFHSLPLVLYLGLGLTVSQRTGQNLTTVLTQI